MCEKCEALRANPRAIVRRFIAIEAVKNTTSNGIMAIMATEHKAAVDAFVGAAFIAATVRDEPGDLTLELVSSVREMVAAAVEEHMALLLSNAAKASERGGPPAVSR